MISIEKFLNPSWKKIGWFFVLFLIAQLYAHFIMAFIPTQILQQFINFILNPLTFLLEGQNSNLIAEPIANTFNAVWQYILATILAREVSHEK